MELTLRPGRHEIIERQDPVHEWRVARLARLGIPWPVAEAAAGQSTGTRWRRWCGGAAPVARTAHPPLIQAGDGHECPTG
jgi:hypothetical protein